MNVKLVKQSGRTLDIVNAARISFGKQIESMNDKDWKLIEYLWTHKHTSPFRHIHFTFHIRAPIFILRQWMKHQVGCSWNEISGRYVPYDEFYEPTEFRKQSEDNKQASDGLVDNQSHVQRIWQIGQREAITAYEELLERGVAREQARSILPLTVYTKVWWTASFQSIMNFIELRDEPTSQVEIQEYARAVKEVMLETFPETTKLWSEIYLD